MNAEGAKKLVEELQKKGIFRSRAVNKFLKSGNLIKSKEDMLILLQAIVDKDAFFPTFIQEHLTTCASDTDDYYDLVASLAKNPRHDYPLVSLIELYKKDPNVALWLVDKLNSVDDEGLAVPLGYLYGGMGKEKPNNLFSLIDKELTKKQKIAFTIAINVASVTKKIPERITDFITSISKSNDLEVKLNAIRCLASSLISSTKVQKHLLHLARKDDDNTRLHLTKFVFAQHEKKRKLVFDILKECSKSKNNSVKNEISMCLYTYAPEYPLECIKIAKRWYKDRELPFDSHANSFLGEIGKGNLNKIFEFMQSWVRNEKDVNIKMIGIPNILSRVYQADDVALIKLLNTINYKNKYTSMLIRNTFKKFLAGGYRTMRRSDDFYKGSEEILLKIARHKKINIRPDQSRSNPLIRTLALIREMETTKKNPSIKDARQNLNQFNHTIRILGKSNLEQLICNQKTHPLVGILSTVFVPKSTVNKKLKEIESEKLDWKKRVRADILKEEYYPFAVLADIEASLSLFKDTDQGIQRMKRGLLSKAEFFDTLIELNVSARLKRKHPVTLQPHIGKSNALDIESTINGTRVLFEIFRPRGDIRLKYIETVHGVGNAIRDKIVKKIDEQIKHALVSKLPVVLIIDKSDAHEIDDFQIIDSLFGTAQITMLFDKEKKEVVGDFPSRAQDSIYYKTKNAHILSAILLVRQYYDRTDLKVKIDGEIFHAPQPAIPLDKKTTDAIKKTVLRNAMF